MAVAIGHRQAHGELLEQRFELRRLSARLVAPAAQAHAVVDQQHQGRRLVGLDLRRVGFGQWHVNQRLRAALAALASEIDPVPLVRAEQRGEVLPGHAGVLVAGGAPGEAGAGGADRPVGPDQRNLDPGGAEDLTENSGDVLADCLQRLVPDDRRETPDEVILTAPGAHDFGGPGVVLVGDRLAAAVAFAPGVARGAGERIGRGAVDRQPRRRVGRSEPQFERGVGADQAVGAVGNSDRHARLFDRGDGDRPVGHCRRLGGAPRDRVAPRRRESDQAQHDETAAERQRDHQRTHGELDKADAGERRGRHRQRIGQPPGRAFGEHAHAAAFLRSRAWARRRRRFRPIHQRQPKLVTR